jgi:ceramide synthetase
LGLLPYRVILHTSYYALDHVTFFPVYWIFNALLVALQVLHVIWTFLILRIAYNAIYDDGVKDLREDSSLSSSQSSVEDENDKNDKLSNGHSKVNGNSSLAGGDVRQRLIKSNETTVTNGSVVNGKANGRTH